MELIIRQENHGDTESMEGHGGKTNKGLKQYKLCYCTSEGLKQRGFLQFRSHEFNNEQN